ADGIPVYIDSAGELGTSPSSRQFKKEIKPMGKASKTILALKPVSFQYKNDSKGTPQFGLVAEEVEKVNPDLVVRDNNREIYAVRYDAVNAMLLNEFLKEHSKVEKLETTVAKQHKDFEAALADLKGQIQKVSAQLELDKPAPQTVLNSRQIGSTNRSNGPSCFTAWRLFVSNGDAHHSLKSPLCSCVSITLSCSS